MRMIEAYYLRTVNQEMDKGIQRSYKVQRLHHFISHYAHYLDQCAAKSLCLDGFNKQQKLASPLQLS